jgi:hypothetical protein
VVTAINVDSSAKLEGFIITNGYGNGGGMYDSNSSPMVANCIFSGNSFNQHGGGVPNYSGSSVTEINFTFSANLAGIDGGMSNYSSPSPTAINCILWGDSPGEIRNTASSMVVTYQDIQGGYGVTEDHNIDKNPLFVHAEDGDFHLKKGSPCIVPAHLKESLYQLQILRVTQG